MALRSKTRAALVAQLALATSLREQDLTDPSALYETPRSTPGVAPATLALLQRTTTLRPILRATGRAILEALRVPADNKLVDANDNDLWFLTVGKLHERVLAKIKATLSAVALQTSAAAAKKPLTIVPSTQLPAGQQREMFVLELDQALEKRMPDGPRLTGTDKAALLEMATHGHVVALIAPKFESFAGREA